jgi:hypothetical protein
MTKCTVIAHCLIKSKLLNNPLSAEQIIKDRFNLHFPAFNFIEWNSDLDPVAANNFIKSFNVNSPLNIDRLITLLWDV